MKLVISPLKTEVSGFLKNTGSKKIFSQKGLSVFKGSINGKDILIAITGMGKDNTLKSMDMLKKHILHADDIQKGVKIMIITTGFCGATAPGLKIGDIIIFEKVINLSIVKGKEHKRIFKKTGERDITCTPDIEIKKDRDHPAVVYAHGATTPEVIGKTSRKEDIYRSFHCSAVDMESYWIAKTLDGEEADLLIARAVSDDLEGGFLEGRFIAFKMIFSLFKPKNKLNLFKVLKNLGVARANITRFLEEFCSYS